MESRSSVKRRTRESDEAAWRNYICPRFGNWPVASITSAEVSSWVGSLVARGLVPSTATRALATLRFWWMPTCGGGTGNRGHPGGI